MLFLFDKGVVLFFNKSLRILNAISIKSGSSIIVLATSIPYNSDPGPSFNILSKIILLFLVETLKCFICIRFLFFKSAISLILGISCR